MTSKPVASPDVGYGGNAGSELGRVEVVDASKSFGEKKVLDAINLEIAPGAVLSLIGPSGGGKSTLLRCIDGLESLDQGFVSIDGALVGLRVTRGKLKRVPERQTARQRSSMGYVFQNFNLFPHLTVRENLSIAPVGVHRRGRDEVHQEASALLESVGLGGYEQKYPETLSGGQAQRVAICRALMMKPRVLLCDEPTSALDRELVGEVLAILNDLSKRKITMIVATHELEFARNASSQVAFIDQGRVVEFGPPSQVLDDPLSSRTRAFLGKSKDGV